MLRSFHRPMTFLPSSVSLPSVRCSFFDQSGHLLRMGDVDRMASARDFDLVAVGSCGVPALEVRIDGSVASGYQHPAWFSSPRRCSDDRFEIVSLVQDLRPGHESGLPGRKVGCEVFVKLRWVKVVKPSAVFFIALDLLRSLG